MNKLCDIRLQLNLAYETALKRKQTRADRPRDSSTKIFSNQYIWPYLQLNFNQIPNKHELFE